MTIVTEAFDTLKAAMQADLSYAWSWHCNIAMPIFDQGVPHRQSNEAAARIMEHIFGVDIRKSREWEVTVGHTQAVDAKR